HRKKRSSIAADPVPDGANVIGVCISSADSSFPACEIGGIEPTHYGVIHHDLAGEIIAMAARAFRDCLHEVLAFGDRDRVSRNCERLVVDGVDISDSEG